MKNDREKDQEMFLNNILNQRRDKFCLIGIRKEVSKEDLPIRKDPYSMVGEQDDVSSLEIRLMPVAMAIQKFVDKEYDLLEFEKHGMIEETIPVVRLRLPIVEEER